MFRPRLWALSGMIALGLAVQAASAGTVTYNVNAGSLSASVQFTTVAGGLDVTVTNTQTGTFSIGQGVSYFSFNVVGLNTPSAFTELKGVAFTPTTAGTTWTLASGTPFNDFGTNVIDHWAFSTSGGSFAATAGPTAPGGSPSYLIFPSTGTVGPGNSLVGNHTPDIIGPADFFLTVAGLTSSTPLTTANFTGLNVGFGTGPDTLTGTPPSVVPLPAAAPAGLAMLGLLFWARRATRKRSA
jgi:hypothetical protein